MHRPYFHDARRSSWYRAGQDENPLNYVHSLFLSLCLWHTSDLKKTPHYEQLSIILAPIETQNARFDLTKLSLQEKKTKEVLQKRAK